MDSNLAELCERLANQAQQASRLLATATTAQKNSWLLASADALEEQSDAIRIANERDLMAAQSTDLSPANLDRLTLTPKRISAAAEGLRQVAALPDPIGSPRRRAVA